VIAAVNGAAADLGLVDALYCDVRFATPQAKLTTAFARRGLIAEYGIPGCSHESSVPAGHWTCSCPAG
jgi:enoyl-CoA hydratase/carnithine racemase